MLFIITDTPYANEQKPEYPRNKKKQSNPNISPRHIIPLSNIHHSIPSNTRRRNINMYQIRNYHQPPSTLSPRFQRRVSRVRRVYRQGVTRQNKQQSPSN